MLLGVRAEVAGTLGGWGSPEDGTFLFFFRRNVSVEAARGLGEHGE